MEVGLEEREEEEDGGVGVDIGAFSSPLSIVYFPLFLDCSIQKPQIRG